MRQRRRTAGCERGRGGFPRVRRACAQASSSAARGRGGERRPAQLPLPAPGQPGPGSRRGRTAGPGLCQAPSAPASPALVKRGRLLHEDEECP